MRGLTGILAVGIVAAMAGCGEKPAAKAPAEGAATTAPAAAPAKVFQAAAPRRKPGLWTQTMALQGFSRTFRYCVDETSDQKLGLWSQDGGGRCRQEQMTRGPEGDWTIVSSCDLGAAGQNRSNIHVTGDFDSRYVMDIAATTTGAAQPTMNGEHKMTMTAEWSGACPSGWTAGDMEMPGGRRMNLLTKTVSGG
ncbi:DUF3617 domain-containing protein [Caulobacter sp. LARHSG274]